MRKPGRKTQLSIYARPWMIVGAAIVLLIIVVVLAVHNIHREKRYMAQILSEKGGALIKAFEAGARTGIMGMMWRGNQVQNLLEETSHQPGLLYLAVTDTAGMILAHSNKDMIGLKFLDDPSIKAINPGPKEQWRLRDYGRGQRSFEVYRYFHPFENASSGTGGRMHPMMMRNDWCFPLNVTGREQVIFVGLDVEPFESALREDMRNTIIISSVLVLLGFGGLLSMFLAQRYRSTRRLLQDKSAFTDEVVSSLPVGLIATDRNQRIAFFNEAAVRITGLKLQEAIGKDFEEMVSTRLCGLSAFLNPGQIILEHEMECVLDAGRTVPLSVSATRIVNEDGELVGNLLILRDLGEVRTLQEEIRRKEKLAALGGLAAGIAHEIRNPLSSIKGLASFFRDKFAEASEEREAATIMMKEVDRLNRVISELLEFARPSTLNLGPTDINQVLKHSLRLVEQDAKAKNIVVNLSEGDHLPHAMLDSDRFSQCLLNLFINGIQAMEKGGTLSVRSSQDSGKFIIVEIEDTGQGIDQGSLPKIFDPYFTTKPSGTGLGLAIVHKIIEAHDGAIKVRSAPGKGTVFTISLPVHAVGDDIEEHNAS
jgi:two-component system sensor histidine kinase HydH